MAVCARVKRSDGPGNVILARSSDTARVALALTRRALRPRGVDRGSLACGAPRGAPSPGAPECSVPPRVPGKTIKNKFSVTVKIRTSGYQSLECFVATLPTWGVYGRLVHVGETFNRFADFGL